MSTYWVKISQCNCWKLFIGVSIIFHYLFNKCLGLSVRVQGLNMIIFFAWWIFTVYASTWWKNKWFYFVFIHQSQNIDCTTNVIVIILKRIFDWFSHSFKSSKMDNRFYFILRKYLVIHRAFIQNVNLEKQYRFWFLSNKFNSFKTFNIWII